MATKKTPAAGKRIPLRTAVKVAPDPAPDAQTTAPDAQTAAASAQEPSSASSPTDTSVRKKRARGSRATPDAEASVEKGATSSAAVQETSVQETSAA